MGDSGAIGGFGQPGARGAMGTPGTKGARGVPGRMGETGTKVCTYVCMSRSYTHELFDKT